MKKKLILLVALLCTAQSVNALSYVKEKDNICTETESYKIWKNLSDKEKENTIIPVRCKEFYTKNMNVTSSVGNAFNVDYKTATKFSLLDYNKVSPVSDQENTNMCWTFATTSAIESAYLIEQNKNINLSERHIDFNTLETLDDKTKNPFGNYSKTKDQGGNFFLSGAYLATGRGPIIETKLPWSTTTSTKANTLEQKIDYYVNEIDYLVNESCDAKTILAMKKNIVEYGAMGAVMYAESPTYISDDKTSYYYNGSNSINHAVTIIGWDDNYSKTKFKTTPAGDGAWLVKNTYPTRFGGTNNLPAGYHYISYYDTNICSTIMNVHNIETPSFDNRYTNNIHGYSGLIQTAYPTIYFKNIYTKTEKTAEQITKVNIFTSSVGDKYEIYFSAEDDFAKAVKIGEGTAIKEGYTTVNVNKTSITTDKYYIYLKYTSTYSIVDSGKTYYGFPVESFSSNSTGDMKWFYVDENKKIKGVSYYTNDPAQWIDTLSNTKVQFYSLINVFTTTKSENIKIGTVTKNPTDLNIEKGGYIYIPLTLDNISINDITLTITKDGLDTTNLFTITKDANGFKITLTDKVTAGSYTAKFTYQNTNATTSFTIEEKQNVQVSAISIIGKDEVSVGGTLNLTAEVSPSNATNKNVSWSVNNTRLASINQKGVLTGYKEGEVIVTVTAKDGSNIKVTKTIKVIDINKEEGNGETIVTPPATDTKSNDTTNPKTGLSNLTVTLLCGLFISITLFILSKKHNVFKKF